MGTSLLRPVILLLAAFQQLRTCHAESEPEIHDEDPGLWRFVTRPDIKAPRWNVSIYDKEALAPGYWFFGPYETLDMDLSIGSGWIGPHIYDQDGSLIWSGAPMFDNGNTEDFRISNVNGEDMMTVMDQRHARGLFIDQHYRVQRRVKVAGKDQGFNSHEFNFVENGTKALVMFNEPHDFSEKESEAVGFEGKCRADCNGFTEFDVASWKETFSWTSCGRIALEESTLTGGNIENKCGEGRRWDYVHANSVDKTPEGDFLFSCRHADALYKISHKDKSIIWRFGGTQSDFEHEDGFTFSRQHDVRYRGGNKTHTIVSFLDNAKGIDGADPTHEFSRGLLVALDESSMTAKIVANYDHPDGDGGLAFRRGNYQQLDNGNVFMCWSEQALQSEHTADGKMLMQARLEPKWLGTYRAYKFEFTGLPKDKPAINGTAMIDELNGGVKTEVHVSWNGATEVKTWNLYRTNNRGRQRVLVDSQEKNGFETKFIYDGFAKNVLVEGVDKNGTALGSSRKIQVETGNITASALTEAEEAAAADEPEEDEWDLLYDHPVFIAGVSIGVLLAALAAAFMGLRVAHRRGVSARSLVDRLSRGKYTSLDTEKELQDRTDRNPLMGRPRRSGSDDDDGLDLDDTEPFAIDDDDDDPHPRHRS